MTKKEAFEIIASVQKDLAQTKLSHKLAQMSVVYENDDESFEIVFAVDYYYAKDFFCKNSDKAFDKFLEEEYTSNDSQEIFEDAFAMRRIQFAYIN